MILIGVDALRTPMSYFLDVHVHVHVCMCMNQAFAKANTPEAAERKLAIKTLWRAAGYVPPHPTPRIDHPKPPTVTPLALAPPGDLDGTDPPPRPAPA